MALKYGRRKPSNKPAIKLGDVLTGTLPTIPASADYIGEGGWEMLGNDQYGDCVAVTWANERRLMTRGKTYPSLEQVIAFYKTQNPDFPAQDDGMDIQTALEYLVEHGGPDGVKALGFAKVDHANPDEVKAAIAIFAQLWTGIVVKQINMSQFDAGQPWDYVKTSKDDGSHSVLTGGYGEGKGVLAGDERFVTWAEETSFTDTFWAKQVEETWVVIWPEHLDSPAFLEGVDQAALASAYEELTGRPFPVNVTPPTPEPPSPAPTPDPPTPTPTPVPPTPMTDEDFARAVEEWAYRLIENGSPRPRDIRLMKAAVAWFDAIGFDGQVDNAHVLERESA